MPTNKDFKRLVRGRMQKTGESYTAARAHLFTKPPSPTPLDYAAITGMGDAVLKAKTGCTWERWVKALDRVAAHTWPHGKIADYVHDKYKVPGWWTQAVTVGYERIKGLRGIGQRRVHPLRRRRDRDLLVDRLRGARDTVIAASRQRCAGEPSVGKRSVGEGSVGEGSARPERSHPNREVPSCHI